VGKAWTWLMIVLVVAGCTSGKPAGDESGKGTTTDLLPVQTHPPDADSVARPDFGYLQVLVRSGAQGQNPAISGAKIAFEERGAQVVTDDSGKSPSIELPAPDSHPVIQSRKIGYYTIVVTKPGFKTHVHHTFVHGGSTVLNPTTVHVYLIPGEGEVVVSDSPVGGRNAPQTPGPIK